MENGIIIVIDGVDASGKSTQSKLLYDKLRSQREDVYFLDFPVYDSPSSAPIKMYLGGEISKNAQDINPYAASTFFAVDRYITFKRDFEQRYNNGGIFVCNRYTTSNAIHQCSKLEPTEYDAFLEWLFDFEHNKMGTPKADLVLFLDMPIKIVKRLLLKRYDGDEGKKDLHESDDSHLEKSYNCAKYVLDKCNFVPVLCSDGDTIRSIDDIKEEIYSRVNNYLKEKGR